MELPVTCHQKRCELFHIFEFKNIQVTKATSGDAYLPTLYLVYTKTVDSVFRALLLATQSVPPSERRQTRVS